MKDIYYAIKYWNGELYEDYADGVLPYLFETQEKAEMWLLDGGYVKNGGDPFPYTNTHHNDYAEIINMEVVR